MRKHRGQPVNNGKGQALIDPLQYGAGAVREAAPIGSVAPRRGQESPTKPKARAVLRPPCSGLAPTRLADARLKAQIRRRLRLRPRQALAPLRTAMWAAYPDQV